MFNLKFHNVGRVRFKLVWWQVRFKMEGRVLASVVAGQVLDSVVWVRFKLV